MSRRVNKELTIRNHPSSVFKSRTLIQYISD